MTRLHFFSFLALIIFSISSADAQVQLYNQNFTDSSGGLPLHWTNTGTGCTWAISTSNSSTGYSGASGGRNLYAGTCTGSSRIMVTNLNTTGYSTIKVIWGARKGTTETGNIQLEWYDGVNWNNVSFTDVSNTGSWALVNGTNQISLPAGAENMANLQLRWTMTNPLDYRMDDFSLYGTLVIGVPVKLVVTNTFNPACSQFRVNQPFNMTIQSQDANGNPANLPSNTPITLTLFSGSGPLGGILAGQINGGTNTTTISGITYGTAQSNVIIRAIGGGLTPGNSASLTFTNSAPQIVFYNFAANGTTNTIIPAFGVLASYGGGQYDSCFIGSVTISQYPSGTNLHGTLTRTSTGGGANFNDIYFDAPGTYQLQAVCSGFSPILSTTINITNGTPSLVEIKVPRNMNGNNLATDNLFNAFLVDLHNLNASTVYRYITAAVDGTDGATSLGSGNDIFVDPVNSTFTRTTNPSLASAYGTFLTDNLGNYRGWFMIEPKNNYRFTAGNNVKYRIILNDGTPTGSTPQTYLTTTQQVKVLNWTATSNGGSFVNVSSGILTPKNFLLAYNGDTLGTGGRPEFINVIENDGLSLGSATEILPDYISLVDGNNGHAGILIPDFLLSGITVLEERTLSGGFMMNSTFSAGDIRSIATSPSGIWPPGISTINMTNGKNAVSIQPIFSIVSVVNLSSEASGYMLSDNYPNPFNPSTKIKFSVPSSNLVKMTVYNVLGKEIYTLINERYSAGTYSVEFNASNLASGVYFYKLEAGDYTATKKMVLIK